MRIKDEVQSISISYSRYFFYLTRHIPHRIILRNLNLACYIFLVNQSLAEKISIIRIYANDYKIGEFSKKDFSVDNTDIDKGKSEGHSFSDDFPVKFNKRELKDRWVRIRPDFGSVFQFDFSSVTPQRITIPAEIEKTNPEK